MINDMMPPSFLQVIGEVLGQDMTLVALGAGAIIGAVVAMLLYSLIFEILVPLLFGKKVKGQEKVEAVVVPDVKMDKNIAKNNDAEIKGLKEVERQMLALRELYEAGLVAPEIYLLKSRELAASVLENKSI